MNGLPSVKVALNPRADGSMSPKYTNIRKKYYTNISAALIKHVIHIQIPQKTKIPLQTA